MRDDGEVFEGMRTCPQYVLGLIPREVLDLNRSKVDYVRELMGEVYRPLNCNQTVDAYQSEAPT